MTDDARCPRCGLRRYQHATSTDHNGGEYCVGGAGGELAALRAERDEMRARADAAEPLLRDLVTALPRCDAVVMSGVGSASAACSHPATRAYRRGAARYCDAHAPADCPEYPRAAPLRRALALLAPKIDETPAE